MKYYLLTLFILLEYSAYSQSWYRNLEKYWWYRYRLVNDFMKVGPSCGESIPAEHRDFGTPNGTLYWGDATQYLGHYMSLLGTEYKLLKSSGFSTGRTDYETAMAINAFDRLDRYAEPLCQDIHVNNNKPCDLSVPGNWTFNGFFIRDDIYGPPLGTNPWDAGFVFDNYNHFNRTGLQSRSKVDKVSSGFSERSKYTLSEWNALYPASSGKQYPTEGNQDQMSELYAGMALILACSDGGTPQNMANVSNSKAAITRLMDWASSWDINNPPYQLRNRLTDDCVYGIKPDTPSCNMGGADMMFSSPGAARATIHLLGSNSTTLGYLARAVGASPSNEIVYQAQAYFCWSESGEMMHADNYALIARDWKHKFFIFSINITWPQIKCKAYAQDFCMPHLPLMYKIHHPSSASLNRGWLPLCLCRGRTHSYTELLDRSTFCGNWADGNSSYGDYEWYRSDFNGIDYMKLFNLYSIVQKDYLQWMINPYYEENFNETFPQYASSTTYGTHTHPLKLNYLEYFSAINTIHSDGHLTYRGAKVIELLPGFDAQTGCYFEAYIQDYDCHREGYCYAQQSDKVREQDYYVYGPYYCLEPYNPHPNRKMSLKMPVDSVAEYEDNLADSLLAMLGDEAFLYSPDSAGYARLLDSLSQGTQHPETAKKLSQTCEVAISPNPATNTLNVTTSEPDDYRIVIFDASSKLLIQSTHPGSNAFTIDVRNLPNGLYYLQLTGKKHHSTHKFTILK